MIGCRSDTLPHRLSTAASSPPPLVEASHRTDTHLHALLKPAPRSQPRDPMRKCEVWCSYRELDPDSTFLSTGVAHRHMSGGLLLILDACPRQQYTSTLSPQTHVGRSVAGIGCLIPTAPASVLFCPTDPTHLQVSHGALHPTNETHTPIRCGEVCKLPNLCHSPAHLEHPGTCKHASMLCHTHRPSLNLIPSPYILTPSLPRTTRDRGESCLPAGMHASCASPGFLSPHTTTQVSA